jgi:hypothetical protein
MYIDIGSARVTPLSQCGLLVAHHASGRQAIASKVAKSSWHSARVSSFT